MKVAVIGGGASGMMAALAACGNGAEVTLLERQARVGRKLLATGNGRCNLTNLAAGPGNYHGDRPDFCVPALDAFPVDKTLAFFHNLGLVTTAEDSGRIYPYSDQANSVVDVLRFALAQHPIDLRLGCEVQKVRKTEAGFLLTLPEDQLVCDRLVIACGGVAGSKLGGTMSGYQILRSLGHKCTRLRPTLVQLKSPYPRLPGLKGIRAQCKAEIFKDGSLFSASQGEIQFTEYGISGPVVFEISRDVCAQKGKWVCRLDLLPRLSLTELTALLTRRRETFSDLTASDLFTGILHNRLGRVLAQEAGLDLQDKLRDLTDSQLAVCAACAKNFTLDLTEPLGMDSAQVTAGGIFTQEFDPQTLESRLVPSLFACGEVLDVDGDCGGYNLQWAWSSGHLAGSSAGKDNL